MNLSEEQIAAVHSDTHALVVACPGSGKTRVLVERTVRLATRPDAPQVVLVTFTRDSATEIRDRLAGRLASLSNVRVATFHSLSLQQLSVNNDRGVIGPSEQNALLQLASEGLISQKHFPHFLSKVDEYHSGNLSLGDESSYQQAYDRFLTLLVKHSTSDLTSSVKHSADAMFDGTLDPIPCDYLLVDEAQDMDNAQLRWIQAHALSGTTVTIVGDDDQSVYGFRKSMGYAGMRSFEHNNRAVLFSLSTNYRSRSEILRPAIRLISANTHRLRKTLVASRGKGGKVSFYPWFRDQLQEAQFVSQAIKDTQEQVAVIARTNRQLDPISYALTEIGVPHNRVGQSTFWDSDEPSLLLRLLSLSSSSSPLTETLVAPRVKHHVRKRLASDLSLLRSHLHSETPSKAIDIAAKFISEHSCALNQKRREQSARRLDAAVHTLKKLEGPLKRRIRLLSTVNKADASSQITLCTMHASKGLEFPETWIVGCQDSAVPHSRYETLEEERRLLYVAMTRAEDRLHITFPWQTTSVDVNGRQRTVKHAPSRFLVNDLAWPVPARSHVFHNDPPPPEVSTYDTTTVPGLSIHEGSYPLRSRTLELAEASNTVS